MWSNTVLSVWYIFSIKTKTKEETEIKSQKSMEVLIRYQNPVMVMISFVLTWWIINEFENSE